MCLCLCILYEADCKDVVYLLYISSGYAAPDLYPKWYREDDFDMISDEIAANAATLEIIFSFS